MTALTWTQAKKKVGCVCRFSDAWRCGMDVSLRTVACGCACHHYMRAPDPPANSGKTSRQKELFEK
jgi:hypothetical protein